MLAAYRGHADCVASLLAAGAETDLLTDVSEKRDLYCVLDSTYSLYIVCVFAKLTSVIRMAGLL
jgi:hypothetical protein